MAADLDWNPSALWNALQMGLYEAMKDPVTYSNMAEELPGFVTVCRKCDYQIGQQRAEKAAQNNGGGKGFASSPRPCIRKSPQNSSC